MSFYHDSTGIDPDAKGELLPDGKWFPFRIKEAVEKKTKSGYDALNLTCEVIETPAFNGKWVWHYVTFIPKGMKGEGMSVHFRKCIGQPFGKNDLIEPMQWIGSRFMGKVKIKEYLGKQSNVIAEVSPFRDVDSPPETAEASEEDIPF